MEKFSQSYEKDNRAKERHQFQSDLKEIQTLLTCKESRDVINIAKDEHLTLFIGNTRSGKSTLVNYVIGNKLIGKKMDDFPFTMSIVKGSCSEPGPVIGLESVSETTLPSIWSIRELQFARKVVDAPGFEDNRGEVQDIANTFYIKEIIRNARSVKFVLVTDINDIMSQNISNFNNFIDKIHLIFPDTRVLHGGIALVFSKECGNFTVENLCIFLKKNILDQPQLRVEKSLIRYFVEHKQFMTFFKMPVSEGPLNGAEIDGGILHIINHQLCGISGKALSDIKPGISDKSRVFLLESYTKLCNTSSYEDLLQEFKEYFKKTCMKVSNAESTEELTRMHETVCGLENEFLQVFPQGGSELTFKNITEKLACLCRICGIGYNERGNVPIQIQFVEFLDSTLNLRNGEIYRKTFQTTIGIIEHQFKMAHALYASSLGRLRELEEERERREEEEKRNAELQVMLDNMNLIVPIVQDFHRVLIDPCRVL